jgi:S-formylglutathione hydrolase
MYSYVTEELPDLVRESFPVDLERQGIFGHSMGGHGALVVAFRNPDRYRSVSAFSPIVAPTRCPWGEKAFTGYLGRDRESWCRYDACELVAESGWRRSVLVDQGLADDFLEVQLTPDRLSDACKAANVPLELRLQDGYDHSHYFIASFMSDHIAHHAQAISAAI